MDDLIPKLIDKVKKSNLLPELPAQLPMPSINKVELYLSFHGNDHCAHCITRSGPHRKDLLSPEHAATAINHIAGYSVLNTIRSIMGPGHFHFINPPKMDEFDNASKPPKKLNDILIAHYAECIMGKEAYSRWMGESGTMSFGFGRPTIRLSGGEFYTWPHQLNGEKTNEAERLVIQRNLLTEIKKELPEYDIWILTNGRFAESRQQAKKVIRHWAIEDLKSGIDNGKTRIAISVDPFHRPPKNRTIEQMLKDVWHASLNELHCAPYIYGIPNKKLFLVGRALENYARGKLSHNKTRKMIRPNLTRNQTLTFDSNSLVDSNGCNELKGFFCQTPLGTILANNIVINVNGDLAYCCVCVGNYGNFIRTPEEALRQMVKDPITLMLKSSESAKELLNSAVELDPTIKVFGNSNRERVSGSTCYQVLSGIRV